MDRRGVHLLREFLFQFRVDHSVLVSHYVEVRLMLPSGRRNLGAHLIRTTDLALGRNDGVFLLLSGPERIPLQLPGLSASGSRLHQDEIPCRRQSEDIGCSGRPPIVPVGSECCYTDETGDLWIISGFRNHSSTVGMSDEKHGAVLKCQRTLYRCRIVGECGEGKVHSRDVKAFLLQKSVVSVRRLSSGCLRPSI